MANEAIQLAAALARRFEGLYLRPYLCPAGIPSVGYGATRYENGVRVSLADPPITAERAEQLLQWELSQVCLPAVAKYCKGQPDAVNAALVDFTFNLGSGRLMGSTLRKKINMNDYLSARVELLKWNKANGKPLAGLTKRRTAESLLL